MKIDKEQLKTYSKEVTKACKLWGYNPSEQRFEDYFDDASNFYFIPYIKELAKKASDDDYFMEELGEAIDEVYDSTVEVTLKEVKDFIKDDDISLSKYISIGIESRDIENEFIIEWFIKNCNDEIIQKFINWVLE